MQEELYIIKESERIRLDLNNPSGITLNFKSNIFGDLSKITCSYSYTFKLPLSKNNIRAFDLADDIRHASKMVRKRLMAEFFVDGIKIFDDANLYLNTVEGSFQAVMTWGVVRGLETLSNNDISIRDLPFKGMPEMAKYNNNTTIPRPEEWKNTRDYFIPFRKSEGGYLYNGGRYIYDNGYGSKSLPVIPVRRIIDAINEYYGTSFYFGEEFDGAKEWDSAVNRYRETDLNNLIALGAVPLVNKGITEKQLEERSCTLVDLELLEDRYGFGLALNPWSDEIGVPNIMKFNVKNPGQNKYFAFGDSKVEYNPTKNDTFYIKTLAFVTGVNLDGCLRVKFGRRIWRNSELVRDYSDVIPKLIIYKRSFKNNDNSSDTGEIEYEEAATLEGVRVANEDGEIVTSGEFTTEQVVFEYDFRASEGKNNLELKDFFLSSDTYPYFISFDVVVTLAYASEIKLIPQGDMTDNLTSGMDIDLRSNLPDISCMTFMKSLYFMIGAFPEVDSISGRIIARYYNTIRDNIKAGKVKDWSKKLQGGIDSIPDKTSFSLSGYSQRNYYLLKNDELESKPEEGEDVYESGMGVVFSDNETLELVQTIIQIPYYGPFLKDGSRPSVNTGHDMKYVKYNDDGTTEFCEAKPAIGIVGPIEQCDYEYPSTTDMVPVPLRTYTMLLSIWNGFKNITDNPSYKALQDFVKEPVVITERIRLDELDLRDLDYSIPIYLEKYNSYFAVVSITRDSKGQCKCELIKLP